MSARPDFDYPSVQRTPPGLDRAVLYILVLWILAAVAFLWWRA